MEEILYIYIILAVIFVSNLFLCFFVFRLRKRINMMLQGGEKNIEEVLVNQIKKTEKTEERMEEIIKQISGLKEISQRSVQKIGMVRFNPFEEVGSDQSFSVALLDFTNSGFIITSHYGKEFSRIYAKPVEKGKSQYLLSKEEQQAIERAVA